MTADEALNAHRGFLQEVLAEVIPELSSGPSSFERLARALERYWEACFARRDVRLAVLESTRNSDIEDAVEPMGRPFQLMLGAELLPQFGSQSEALAKMVYDGARAIAVDEAVSGNRDRSRRQALLAKVRG